MNYISAEQFTELTILMDERKTMRARHSQEHKGITLADKITAQRRQKAEIAGITEEINAIAQEA